MPPRPHPLAVSRFARTAGKLVAWTWSSGLSHRPPLDPEYLWRVGSRSFSPDDETSVRPADDVADFRDRLERLCRSLREEADLNPLGHTMAYGQITAAIRKRHALGRLWRMRPELCTTPIAPPIVVVGQMRAGTTRLQRLLAADPAHAGTRFCDSHDPVPRIPDWRPLRGRLALAIARRINPWLDTLHPFGATRTDEEIGWLSAALDPCAFEAQWRIPAYVDHCENGDSTPVYREFARILRTDAAHHDNAGCPRILKCPQFAEDLPALLDQFPGARVVVAERDEAGVLASTVSMVAAQSAFQSDTRDVGEIEHEWQRKIALREERLANSLAAYAGPVARISFDQLNRDWRSAMRSAYDQLGLDLPAEALASMAGEQAQAADDAHHRHGRQLRAFARA